MENKLILTDRHFLSMNGVKKVNNVNETMVSLQLDNDSVSISGKELHINKLDLVSTEIELEGKVETIKFGKTEKGNLFKKVFK